MIETSEFYNKLNILEGARQTGINNLTIRGVRCSTNASIPTVVSKILDIPITKINTTTSIIRTSGSVVIVAAELPGVTLSLKDASGETTIDEKSTDPSVGGAVFFETSITDETTFMVVATSAEGEELWTNTIYVPTIGYYNCKTGKAFADYTEAEVNTAAKNHYARWMWSVGDSRTIATMGTNKEWVIAAFDHYDLSDGDGKAGMVMTMKSYTDASYKHNSTNSNTIGWEGSLIRQNGLKNTEVYYVAATVDGATEGLYYTYDEENCDWVQHTLPEEYDANEKYYTQEVKSEDGAYITGLPDWAPHMVRVKTKTADSGSSYKKIITSNDWVFINSDGEIFGSSNRYYRFSQYEKEGEQLDYYRDNFSDVKIRSGNSLWLRSPYSSTAGSFCDVTTYGFVDYNSAYGAYRVRLAFCL